MHWLDMCDDLLFHADHSLDNKHSLVCTMDSGKRNIMELPHAKVRGDIEKLLKCVKCKSVLSFFPIRMEPIETGWNYYCGRCKAPEGSGRNDIYESISQFVKFPCRYNSNGCKEYLFPNAIPEHEETCSFKVIECPSKASSQCPWTGQFVELLDHYYARHEVLILTQSEFEIVLLDSFEEQLLYPAGENLFLIKQCTDSMKLDLSVKYIPLTNSPNRFSYEMRIKSRSEKNIECIQLPIASTKNDEHSISLLKLREKFGELSTLIGEIDIVINTGDISGKNPKEKDSITNELVERLMCPVCFEYMLAQIHQCVRGHSLCGKCRQTINICPLCNQEIRETRNFDLETIAKFVLYPCHNEPNGCSYSCNATKIKDHEQCCPYSSIQCPVSDYENCNLKVPLPALYEHLLVYHHDYLLQTDLVVQPIDTTVVSCFFLKYDSHIFQLHYSFDEEELMWSMQAIDLTDELNNFCFEIDIYSVTDRKTRVCVRAPTISSNTKIKDVFELDNKPIIVLRSAVNAIIHDDIRYRVSIFE